jgi:hypothetical protein
MPASRKPPRKGPTTPSSKSESGAVKLPDRRVMESFMSAIRPGPRAPQTSSGRHVPSMGSGRAAQTYSPRK